MNDLKVYADFSNEDPNAFREGFMDFAEKVIESYNEATRNGHAKNPREAGYEYAIGLALDTFASKMIQSIHQHFLKEEKQAQAKDYLERLFEI